MKIGGKGMDIPTVVMQLGLKMIKMADQTKEK